MTDELLRNELCSICSPENVASSLIVRLAYSRDASSYSMVPRAIVRPDTLKHIIQLFDWSVKRKIALTFRAAGTSLSGQSVGDGIIIEIARKWREFEVLDNGLRIRAQPGIIAGRLNAILKPYSRKLGPDPASVNTCTIGGILANNSSGMCCGVQENSYHTVESLAFLLPDGTFVNTANNDADDRLQKDNPLLYEGIALLRQEILSDSSLCELIRRKYQIKNTIGYSLNAFLDAEKPTDILAKLFIGSEGTLGFIAEATFRTIADKQFKSTAMLYFADVPAACRAIVPLQKARATAIELMDRSALRSVEDATDSPATIRSLPKTAAALLIEFQANTKDELDYLEKQGKTAFALFNTLHPVSFTRDVKEQNALWKIRKGMLPTIGATRNSGTGLINEDIAFPIEKLADAVSDLQIIFQRFGYEQAIIFGHAKDGNLHFVLTQKFDTDEDIAKFDALMQEVASLVIDKYGGSFKAEHGTGRNAAPFVEKEWGAKLYEIMKRLKSLIDPHNILNPGIILNDDPKAHVRFVKTYPKVDPLVDKCIECGFCELHCPSRDLTLTPRHRIIIQREISAAIANGDRQKASELEQDFLYAGIETCATDGMCGVACPVGIDTGEYIKKLRQKSHSAMSHKSADFIARNFGLALRFVRLGISLGHAQAKILGNKSVISLTKKLKILHKSIPQWNSSLTSAPKQRYLEYNNAEVVYFPSCIGRMLGKNVEGELQEIVLQLCNRAGITVKLPHEAFSLCCGLPFSSKGYDEASKIAKINMENAVERWTNGGKIPIILDANSCSHSLKNYDFSQKYKMYDVIELAANALMPRLNPVKLPKKVALHPTCSAIRSGIANYFEIIAKACAEEVFMPISTGCCGFAGDRGFIAPELPESATLDEAHDVRMAECSNGYSGNITCEIAMSEATGIQYRSILYLLEEATRDTNLHSP